MKSITAKQRVDNTAPLIYVWLVLIVLFAFYLMQSAGLSSIPQIQAAEQVYSNN